MLIIQNLKTGQHSSFTSNNIFYKAEIISGAVKLTGNYPDWFNISYHHLENKKGDVESIGLKTIENLKLCSNEYESIVEVHNSDFHNAKLADCKAGEKAMFTMKFGIMNKI